jgi:BTB/POZ domain
MFTENCIAFKSYRIQKNYSLTWKIDQISSYSATQQAPLKSFEFSTDEEMWQLGMYQADRDELCCTLFTISIRSEKVSFKNVNVELSMLINERKHFINKTMLKLYQSHQCELWNVERKSLDLVKQPGLEGDVLTIVIDIEIWEDSNSEVINFQDKRHLNLNIQMTKMLADQTLTDVTLKVKDKEFKAHKVILAAASPVFKAMFKEGTKEHEDSCVNIQDMDSDVFEVFLRFLYSGQVDQLDEMISELFVAADKYDVQPLREICIHHMAKNISMDNAVNMLILADRYGLEPIKIQAQKFITNNIMHSKFFSATY